MVYTQTHNKCSFYTFHAILQKHRFVSQKKAAETSLQMTNGFGNEIHLGSLRIEYVHLRTTA